MTQSKRECEFAVLCDLFQKVNTSLQSIMLLLKCLNSIALTVKCIGIKDWTLVLLWCCCSIPQT